jgi:hypothetical protein
MLVCTIYHVTIFVTETETNHPLRRSFILRVELQTGKPLFYLTGSDVA